LGDGGTVRKLVVATTAGADDAMPARREKAIFDFSLLFGEDREGGLVEVKVKGWGWGGVTEGRCPTAD
jgi:hypothetical protein